MQLEKRRLQPTKRLIAINQLLRHGRFDLLLQIPPPDEEARLEIFKIHTAKNTLAENVSLQEIVEETEGYTGAEIEAVCREATMRTIRRFLNSGTDSETPKPHRLEVTMDDLKEAVKKINERKKIADNSAGEASP